MTKAWRNIHNVGFFHSFRDFINSSAIKQTNKQSVPPKYANFGCYVHRSTAKSLDRGTIVVVGNATFWTAQSLLNIIIYIRNVRNTRDNHCCLGSFCEANNFIGVTILSGSNIYCRLDKKYRGASQSYIFHYPILRIA